MSLDVLCLLPGPSSRANAGTACLRDQHDGQLLAYGASSAVIVVDVQRLTIATSLVGLHRNAAVSALAWHPGLGPRDPKGTAQLLLASGDDEGRVVVWNVTTGSAIAALEDPVGAAFPGVKRPEGSKPSVQGLAWVTSAPTLLAVLLAPGYLVLWDFKAGSVVWRRDLSTGGGGGEVFTGIKVDPQDRRQMCVCGSRGSFVVLKALNPAMDKVKQQQYQVDIGQQGTVQCSFSTTHDLLFVVLQREIIVFDLEFGQPAASTPLPGSRPPLERLLGSYGHAAASKSLRDGGLDVLYCSHTDGSISVWQRQDKQLTFTMLGLTKLLPPAPKCHSGRGPQLLSLAACLWRGLQPGMAGGLVTDADEPASGSLLEKDEDLLPRPASRDQIAPADWNPFEVGTSSTSGSREQAVDIGAAGAGRAASGGAPAPGTKEKEREHRVLVMGVCNEGQVWQWELLLLEGTLWDPKPAMPKAQLLGLIQGLSHKVTNFSVCTSPVALPGGSQQVVAALAAATANGNIELVTVQQGTLAPLQATVTASIAAHKSNVPGMRWLGNSARIVSYSTEKTQTGYKNSLVITDVRNRVSTPMRDSPSDPAPILAVRGSPTGRYLLVVFRGMPSEIWAVGGGDKPVRLRQIDLQFTAVEWMGEVPTNAQPDPASLVGRWEPSALAQQRAADGFPVTLDSRSPGDDMPDERLAFSLVDGRVGVLAVKGRRIADTHPKRPVWLPLVTGEYRATAVAGWNHLVFFGDAEGGLVKWDTSTGRTFVMETGQGKIHKIYVGPSPCEHLYPQAAKVQARVAVLYSTGTFAVFELDHSNELRATLITASLVSSRLGRVADVEWLPLPAPVGSGTALAVTLSDGSLAVVDSVQSLEIRPRQQRLLRYKTVLNYDRGTALPRLAPGVPVASPLLLPRSWVMLLRVLLQRGVAEGLFRELAALAASTAPSASGTSLGKTLEAERMLERLEGDIWSRLPTGCQVAWEALLARHSDTAEMPVVEGGGSGGSVARILDDFADTAEEDMQSLEAAIAATQGGQSAPQGQPAAVAASPAPLPPSARGFRRPYRPVPHGEKKKEPAINFKSIGGAFASMATVSKEQLSRTLGIGRGVAQGGMSIASSAVWDGQDVPQSKAAFQCLITVLQAAGYLRGLPSVLSAAELAAYQQALAQKCTASRMVVAAGLGGDWEEATFWKRLPTTLRWLKATLQQARSRSTSQADEPCGPQQQRSSGSGGAPSGQPSGGLAGTPGQQPRLWEESKELAEAGERSAWREQMPRSIFENSEQLQEKRVLQYVALGDYHTAVGFLLASGPESTARYYRNALCTLAMAFACGTQQAQQGGAAAGGGGLSSGPGGATAGGLGAIEDATARTLFSQAAKVITANAASVGDSLLGVPLLCSTGQHAEAVGLLQDSGLWHYAAALTASRLRGSERAAALERWAAHVAGSEGRLWSAAGLLVAAGALRSALQLLRQAGLADAAFALIAACREAEVPVEQHNMETGELQNLFPAAGMPVRRFNSVGEPVDGAGRAALPRRAQTDYEANDTAREFQLYICDVLQQL